MPDSNDFFGSGARSNWAQRQAGAPRYGLTAGGHGLPAAPSARPPRDTPAAYGAAALTDQRPMDPPGGGATRYGAPPAEAEQRAAPAAPPPAAPAAGAGRRSSSTLDWTELTGAGNFRPSGGPQESTPIFDALVSAWFRKGSSLFGKDTKTTASGAETENTAAEPEATNWSSAADQGWQAADAVAHSRPDSFTNSGLPRRTPNARLLPGSMGAPAAGRHVERKPEQMRSRLSEFQRGASEGRHNVSTKRWAPVWEDGEQIAE